MTHGRRRGTNAFEPQRYPVITEFTSLNQQSTRAGFDHLKRMMAIEME